MNELIFSSLVISSLFLASSGQQYNCNGQHNVDPPANISNPYVYPANWYPNDSPPQFASGQNCAWKFTVPKGMYVYLTVKANATNAAVLQITDSTNYVTTIQTASQEPYYLLDPSFTVSLISSGVGTMGMTVTWYNVKQVSTAPRDVFANGSPLALSDTDFDNGVTIVANNKVSLLSIPPTNSLIDLSPYMRVTQVYDGPDINSTLLGNLYQVMNSDMNLVSSGRYLTLYSLVSGYNLGNVAVVQDSFDVQQFKSYKAVWCILSNLCQLSLDASRGPVAALRYSPLPSYVKGMYFTQTSSLSVYTDYVDEAHKLVVYTANNSKTNLPQEFRSTFTTFVLDQGQTLVQLSSNPADAKWSIPFEGRHGFVASPNFPMDSVMQNFTDQLSGAGTFNISYTVDRVTYANGAQLQVTIFDGQTAVVDNVYSSSNPPQSTVWSKGDNLLVRFIPNGNSTNGAFVSFQFDKYNSASCLNILSITITIIVVTLWTSS